MLRRLLRWFVRCVTAGTARSWALVDIARNGLVTVLVGWWAAWVRLAPGRGGQPEAVQALAARGARSAVTAVVVARQLQCVPLVLPVYWPATGVADGNVVALGATAGSAGLAFTQHLSGLVQALGLAVSGRAGGTASVWAVVVVVLHGQLDRRGQQIVVSIADARPNMAPHGGLVGL